MGFEIPAAAVEAVDLTKPTLNAAAKIQPTDIVLVMNRGRKTLYDMFDAREVPMPAGLFKMEFDAALHFQRRLIVPGTRNVEANAFVSWLGILGTADGRVSHDPPELCEPFSDEQLIAFGEKVEAIDRGAFSSPADRDVQLVRTGHAVAQTLRSGTGQRGFDASGQATDEASARAEHILDPPTESATREAEAEAAVAGVRPEPRRNPVPRGGTKRPRAGR
jgi:hypothetical protein